MKRLSLTFPWMKIHGSIEAMSIRVCLQWMNPVSMNENSWLYWSGFFGDNGFFSCSVSMNENSWLYWSRFQRVRKCSRNIQVSMNENSWLYWSGTLANVIVHVDYGFHEWKFMALLKHRDTDLPQTSHGRFPWMKIHGSIEAGYPTG